ncbi:MAG: hypothetical protein A2V93_04660 [Ignavibacteria bacterium RBG_16_34_14]|nr:MAG: hypothetical protein A2V93_04660 [Ignavibacteria bacterium RBG_16_34_14]
MAVEYISKLYKAFEVVESKIYNTLLDGSEESFDILESTIFKDLSVIDLMELYRKEMDLISELKFPVFKNELKRLRSFPQVSHYENGISTFVCFIVYWIWHNRLDLSRGEIAKIIESKYFGTLGYRLIDIQHDSNLLGVEVIYLGNYLIHYHEHLLTEVFGIKDTSEIINKYFLMYSEVEYFEKKNRWKSCPFSWDKPEKLGYKGAPFFSTIELLFRFSGMEETKKSELIKGLIAFTAAIQMMDDISDAKEDLINGIESLVMSGFYKKYGKSTKLTDELINQFLNQERMTLFYNTTQNLFDIARKNFIQNNDEIFLLCLEIYNYRFNRRIELSTLN